MLHSASIRTVGRPAARNGPDARELLLDAATELFALHGVAATTFAQIAKQAGLTPAMLHYYFENRDQLLDAVVQERFLRFVAHVWDPVHPGSEPEEAIQGIVGRMLEAIERMPWVPSMWLRDVVNEGGLLRERVQRRLPYEKAQLLGSAIARGQANGSLNRELDPLLTVSSAVGLVLIHMATIKPWAEKFQREPLARRALQRHITGLLLNGLCTKRTKPKRISKNR